MKWYIVLVLGLISAFLTIAWYMDQFYPLGDEDSDEIDLGYPD